MEGAAFRVQSMSDKAVVRATFAKNEKHVKTSKYVNLHLQRDSNSQAHQGRASSSGEGSKGSGYGG